MNSIQFLGNNGSVPDHLFHQFKITLYENDISFLTISQGRDLVTRIIENESLSILPGTYRSILSGIQKQSFNRSNQIQVGGPEKTIAFLHNNIESKYIIAMENSKAVNFFHECLDLCNTGLRTRLAEFL